MPADDAGKKNEGWPDVVKVDWRKFSRAVLVNAAAALFLVAVLGIFNLVLPLLDRLIASSVERVFRAYEPSAHTLDYVWRQPGDDQPKPMLRTTDGVCYLVHVSGVIEEVEVIEDDGWWVLQGNAGSPITDIISEARARCWRFPWVAAAD